MAILFKFVSLLVIAAIVGGLVMAVLYVCYYIRDNRKKKIEREKEHIYKEEREKLLSTMIS